MTDAKTEGERMSAEPDHITVRKLGRDIELLAEDIRAEMNLRGYTCAECSERIYPFDGKPVKTCCASFVDEIRTLLSEEVAAIREVYSGAIKMRSSPKPATDEEIKVNLGKCDTCGEPAIFKEIRVNQRVAGGDLYETAIPANATQRFCKIHIPKGHS